ncbi:Glutamine--tRNA ligase [bioreactor metagenome]|uniref:Glutamine--tRNA ligase n=1 Tax=bioreactor metagenome TaxID=1076179 RepID=A0A645B6U5_9ZZZZ
MCSIEFENHRPLYDWVVNKIGFEKKPHQYEFARLNVTHTVMSKRYLRSLVEQGVVDGWDDPRMPTLCGLRRRGYTASSIIEFVKRAGVSKAFSIVDIDLLEHCIRDELNFNAQRRIAVIDPVKVVIENYPEDKTELFQIKNNPNDPEAGERQIPFTREMYVERSDFLKEKSPKFFRLYPGGEVRLMSAYIIKCTGFEIDAEGNVTLIRCEADLETGGKNPADGRKIKGTIHWVSASNCIDADIMKYGLLFNEENLTALPEDKSYGDYLNPDSIKKISGAKLELSLSNAKPGDKYQFVRNGYFCRDTKNAGTFNSIVDLKDSYTIKEK